MFEKRRHREIKLDVEMDELAGNRRDPRKCVEERVSLQGNGNGEVAMVRPGRNTQETLEDPNRSRRNDGVLIRFDRVDKRDGAGMSVKIKDPRRVSTGAMCLSERKRTKAMWKSYFDNIRRKEDVHEEGKNKLAMRTLSMETAGGKSEDHSVIAGQGKSDDDVLKDCQYRLDLKESKCGMGNMDASKKIGQLELLSESGRKLERHIRAPRTWGKTVPESEEKISLKGVEALFEQGVFSPDLETDGITQSDHLQKSSIQISADWIRCHWRDPRVRKKLEQALKEGNLPALSNTF